MIIIILLISIFSASATDHSHAYRHRFKSAEFTVRKQSLARKPSPKSHKQSLAHKPPPRLHKPPPRLHKPPPKLHKPPPKLRKPPPKPPLPPAPKFCNASTVANALLAQRRRERSMLWILANLQNAPWSNFENTSDAIGYFYNYHTQIHTPFDRISVKQACQQNWGLSIQGYNIGNYQTSINASHWQQTYNSSYLYTVMTEMAGIMNCNISTAHIKNSITIAIALLTPTIYDPHDTLCISDASMWSVPNLLYQSNSLFFLDLIGIPVMWRPGGLDSVNFVYKYGTRYSGLDLGVYNAMNLDVLNILLLQMIADEEQNLTLETTDKIPHPEGQRQHMHYDMRTNGIVGNSVPTDETGGQIGLLASVLMTYFLNAYTGSDSNKTILQNTNVTSSYRMLQDIGIRGPGGGDFTGNTPNGGGGNSGGSGGNSGGSGGNSGGKGNNNSPKFSDPSDIDALGENVIDQKQPSPSYDPGKTDGPYNFDPNCGHKRRKLLGNCGGDSFGDDAKAGNFGSSDAAAGEGAADAGAAGAAEGEAAAGAAGTAAELGAAGAGIAEGAEAGALGGPVGAAVGAAVGGAIAGYEIWKQHQNYCLQNPASCGGNPCVYPIG